MNRRLPSHIIRCSLCGLLLGMAAGGTAMAETVSQKEAKALAQQFFNQAYHEQTAPVKLAYTGKRLTTDRLFTPFYVYNQQRGGFVIISAENKTFPILGYSLKSNFDADRLSESERAWLKGYAHDIEMIRYDSRVPQEAIEAWQDYPAYVVGLLDAPYDATDPSLTPAEAYADLDNLLYTPDDSRDGNFSAMYTPAQWEALVADHQRREGSVAIGEVDTRKVLTPAVVHGRKGSMFRIMFDRPNDWLLRLNAAEYLGDRQVALLSSPTYTPEPEPEETPFEFYDSFMAEVEAQTRAADEAAAAIPAIGDEVSVRSAGAGHFDVLLPENAVLAMIYNLNGSYIGRATYKGQPMAHINIESEPAGFYFAIIYGESGYPYGVKLYR